jgi:hypothetical protein
MIAAAKGVRQTIIRGHLRQLTNDRRHSKFAMVDPEALAEAVMAWLPQ